MHNQRPASTASPALTPAPAVTLATATPRVNDAAADRKRASSAPQRVGGERVTLTAEALARRGARQLAAVVGLVWIPLAVVAALTGAFARGPAPLIPAFVLTCTLGLVLWHRRSPSLRAFVERVPLQAPVLFHVCRAVIGADFLRRYAAGELPASFALHAGVGDLVAGLGALLVLWPMRAPLRRRVLFAWNLVAFVDIFTVVVSAQLLLFSGDTLLRGAFATPPYGAIPFLLVPVFATHVYLFARLRRTTDEARR